VPGVVTSTVRPLLSSEQPIQALGDSRPLHSSRREARYAANPARKAAVGGAGDSGLSPTTQTRAAKAVQRTDRRGRLVETVEQLTPPLLSYCAGCSLVA
jgi:hypothetical protein